MKIFKNSEELQKFIQDLPVPAETEIRACKNFYGYGITPEEKLESAYWRINNRILYVYEGQLFEPVQWRVCQRQPHEKKFTDPELLVIPADTEYEFWIDSDQGETCECSDEELDKYGCNCEAWISYDEEFFGEIEKNYPELDFRTGDGRSCKYAVTGDKITPGLLNEFSSLVEKILHQQNS